MPKGCGGKQNRLCSSLINEKDTQTVVFAANGDSPFWMTPLEREVK
jgi:hypothetical protein